MDGDSTCNERVRLRLGEIEHLLAAHGDQLGKAIKVSFVLIALDCERNEGCQLIPLFAGNEANVSIKRAEAARFDTQAVARSCVAR